MSERFNIVPMVYVEDGDLYTSELRLLLFQVEGYAPTSIPFNDEDGIPAEAEATKVFMKSGCEYDILMPITDFDQLFK